MLLPTSADLDKLIELVQMHVLLLPVLFFLYTVTLASCNNLE